MKIRDGLIRALGSASLIILFAGCSGDSGAESESQTTDPTGTSTSTTGETSTTTLETTTSSTTSSTTSVDTTSTETTESTGVDPYCGDGVIDDGEECDDGELNSDAGACTTTCAAAFCGDQHVQEGVESCDDGNDDDTDACLSTCVEASCGDGYVGPGEACDDGNDVDGDECSNTCALPSCGDAIVQDGEECDDGNDVETDECLATCIAASCGDGYTYEGVEECDDGNDDDTDECTSECAPPACDDLIVSGDESDVDCGGSCQPCGDGLLCNESPDCESQLCSGGTCALPKSCKELNDGNPGLNSGVYLVDPDADGPVDPFDVYCDMEFDNGGWTLVLQNNRDVKPGPQPVWEDAINSVNTTGTFGADLTKFDLFTGLAHWNSLGSELRVEVGTAPDSITKRATYPFMLDGNDKYMLVMEPGMVLMGNAPGLYTYHNNRRFTSSDQDNDVWGGNCAANYGGYAWWYGACWSGSLWGSSNGSHQDAPYWSGSGGDHHNYGAIWVR